METHELARMAGVTTGDGIYNAGAWFLELVAETWAEWEGDTKWQVPAYALHMMESRGTARMWQAFTELHAWQHDGGRDALDRWVEGDPDGLSDPTQVCRIILQAVATELVDALNRQED